MKLTGGVTRLNLLLTISVSSLCFYALVLQSRYLGSYKNAEPPAVAPKQRRHDKTSTFSIMRTRGRLYDEENNGTQTSRITIDALSIGTQFKMGLIEAQSRTWASHRALRHFFAATELDDADTSCYKTLNKTTIKDIIRLCTKEKPYAKRGMRVQYEQFANGFQGKGPGWFCAQQRVAAALETLGRFYRRELAVDFKALPDFLLLQDDDTYYNMVRMEDFLKDLGDPSIPVAQAPCLIRLIDSNNFSFPWGGFGFILSRGAIENLIRPIYCNSADFSYEFERNVCSRLKDDILGESQYFQEGMSVSDLMGAHVKNNLFTQFLRTNWSYCLHSDWSVGYYVNFYYLASHIKDPKFARVAEQRIESTLGGDFDKDRGNCEFGDVNSCNETAHVCHGQTAKSMTARTQEIAAKSQGEFRNYH